MKKIIGIYDKAFRKYEATTWRSRHFNLDEIGFVIKDIYIDYYVNRFECFDHHRRIYVKE